MMMNSPPIEKMLVMSTAHLPCPITPENAPDPIWYEKGDYGWLVYARLFRTPYDTTPELIDIMTYADKLGCEWVMFDCDATILPNFPTFEW